MRKSESSKPEEGAPEVDRPMEEANEATSDLRASTSYEDLPLDFLLAIVSCAEGGIRRRGFKGTERRWV